MTGPAPAQSEVPSATPSAGHLTNVAALVAGHAQRDPAAVAVVEAGPGGRRLSWAELDHQVSAVASGLAARGLVGGHRVAICGPNRIEFVVAYFAAMRAGFVAVPLNPQLADVEIRQMLTECGARVLLAETERADVGEVGWLPLTRAGLGELAAEGTAPISSPQDREALAVLLYTAGTSGTPKAAMLTHRALLAHLDHVAALDITGPDTVALAILPFFHVFGLNAVLGSWARSGGRLVVADGTEDTLAVVRAEQVDLLPLAPGLIYQLLADDTLSAAVAAVTSVLSGAAPLPRTVQEAFLARTGLRIDQGYGLTEAAPGVTVTVGGASLGSGHVGRALPGVEVRIGNGADESEPDEIWIRGENLFSGYWPDGRGGPGSDGWFATGDIGYRAGGELFLVDRARELIIVNGFNVFPAEVEQVIAEVPGVDDVAVVGQTHPRTGEQVVAFVVGRDLSVEMVMTHCGPRLARFKQPAVVKIVDELPRGATGKIKKGALRHTLGRAEDR